MSKKKKNKDIRADNIDTYEKDKKVKVKENVPENSDNIEENKKIRDDHGRLLPGHNINKGKTWKQWKQKVKETFAEYFKEDKLDELYETAYTNAKKGDTKLLTWLLDHGLKEKIEVDITSDGKQVSFNFGSEDDSEIKINKEDKKDIKDAIAKQVIKEVLLKPYEEN